MNRAGCPTGRRILIEPHDASTANTTSFDVTGAATMTVLVLSVSFTRHLAVTTGGRVLVAGDVFLKGSPAIQNIASTQIVGIFSVESHFELHGVIPTFLG